MGEYLYAGDFSALIRIACPVLPTVAYGAVLLSSVLESNYCIWPSVHRLNPAERTNLAPCSLQLRVLRLGLLQDGNVGIDFFAEARVTVVVRRAAASRRSEGR